MIRTIIRTCPEREAQFKATAERWQKTVGATYEVVTDKGIGKASTARARECFEQAVDAALAGKGDLFLLLEDDCDFDPGLEKALGEWDALKNLREGQFFMGTLYAPITTPTAVLAHDFHAGQALVVNRAFLTEVKLRWNYGVYALRNHWSRRLAQIASDLNVHLFVLQPNPVQHVGPSSLGHPVHTSPTFGKGEGWKTRPRPVQVMGADTVNPAPPVRVKPRP